MADTQRKLEAWLSPLVRHMVRGHLHTALWSGLQPRKQHLGEMEHIFKLSLGPSRAACIIFKVVVFFCVLRPALWKDSDYLKAFAPAFYLQEYPFSKTWDHPLSEYSGVRPGRISLTPNVYRFVTQVPSHERVFSVSSICFPSSLHSQGLYAFS